MLNPFNKDKGGYRSSLMETGSFTPDEAVTKINAILEAFSSDTIDSYAKSLLSMKDVSKACKLIEEFANNVFKSGFAGELKYGEAKIEHLKERQKRITSNLKALRKAIQTSPKQVPVANQDIVALKWETPDKIKLSLLVAGAAITLIASGVTPYTAWSASDIPFISDNKILSAALASIVPMSGIAFEGMSNAWESSAGRRNFRNIIYGVTAVSIGSLLFQLDKSFGNLFSANVDIDAIFANNSSHLMLNQILAEVAVGSTLLISVRNMIEKYRPAKITTPPEIDHLLQTEKNLIEEEAGVDRELQHVLATMKIIDQQCKVAVMQAGARFRVLRDLFSSNS